jgi:peptidoglycan/LPS O-acetylase OafA/YrhL
MAKLGAKILTIVPVAMFIVLAVILRDTNRIGQDPMSNPAYRFMIRIMKPGIITACVSFALGCGLFSLSVSRRSALITGGILTTLSVLFGLTMSAFVSIHSWSAVFLLFWALTCVAALMFLLAAVARYVAHLVRSRPTVEDLSSRQGSNSQ